MERIELKPAEFVALVNQTLEYAYPNVTVVGELSNFRVSKNAWVYFDLKDDEASVKCFGTVYQLPGPLEDGMLVAVRGVPRLHPLYGFSLTTQQIRPVGEGSLKKAASLLESKLAAEGLFQPERKRLLPYPPRHIGLITSGESAAYRDFVKVLGERWGGMKISLIDVQVQGEPAAAQIGRAIAQFNAVAQVPDVLVITRGGGSADDLQAFNTEQVVRAVAGSRIPTLVAIGHEVDICLAELAADRRASTPSNAAELLVPDRRAMLAHLATTSLRLQQLAQATLAADKQRLERARELLQTAAQQALENARSSLAARAQLLAALSPQLALQRGYALVRAGPQLVRSGSQLQAGDAIVIELHDAQVAAHVTTIFMSKKKGKL